MIKMIATDIDGTILKWGLNFTPELKNCIKNLSSNGIKVVLVTGRMHIAAMPVARELGLNTPIISYQGGLIKDISGKTLYQNTLSPKYAKEIIQWARKNNIHINLYLDDKLYVEHDNDIVKYYTDGKFIDYTVCSFDDLKIDSGDAKKSLGVQFLCNLWGIKKEELLTIGDQNNDIDLVKAGGIGVAMGNGSEELKACADYITDTVENNGFVKAIEKFVTVAPKI